MLVNLVGFRNGFSIMDFLDYSIGQTSERPTLRDVGR